jgi:hypothetical protein
VGGIIVDRRKTETCRVGRATLSSEAQRAKVEAKPTNGEHDGYRCAPPILRGIRGRVRVLLQSQRVCENGDSGRLTEQLCGRR